MSKNLYNQTILVLFCFYAMIGDIMEKALRLRVGNINLMEIENRNTFKCRFCNKSFIHFFVHSNFR